MRPMKKFKHKIINVDESFNDIFDSSLVDYSEDFNKADERFMMNNTDAFVSFYVDTAKKNESVIFYAVSKILKETYVRYEDFAFEELEKAMKSIFESKSDLKPAEVILDWMRWVGYLTSELVSTKLYYPKYRFWGNAFTGHGLGKQYEALNYILNKWFYMMVNSVEQYKNVFDGVMEKHPLYRKMFSKEEIDDNKMDEGFENVFDSSLVDYSEDFEFQDRIVAAKNHLEKHFENNWDIKFDDINRSYVTKSIYGINIDFNNHIVNIITNKDVAERQFDRCIDLERDNRGYCCGAEWPDDIIYVNCDYKEPNEHRLENNHANDWLEDYEKHMKNWY